MFRYIKAIFGIYDHTPYTQEKFLQKFKSVGDLFFFHIISDLHIGSEYQDNPKALQIVQDIQKLPPDQAKWVFALGDIFDFVCAPIRNLDWMYDEFAKLFLFLFKKYRLGNHEGLGENEADLLHQYFDSNKLRDLKTALSTEALGEYIVTAPNGVKVMLDHGDLFTQKQRDDYMPYRYKKHGASGAKLIQVEFFDKLDWLKTRRPLPKGFIEAVYDKMVTAEADVCIVGHFHVEAIRYYFLKGKIIIVLPAHQFNSVAIPKLAG